ncbi:MAG: hypothetical protein ACT4PN_06915 [Nitrospiraceae bacterium]
MPTIEVNDEQILRCLDQLSPAGRRAAPQKLIGGLERLDLLMERNRSQLERVCQARGIEFSKLTEEQRDTLIDEILHERAT